MDVEIDVRELIQRDLGDPVYRGSRAWKFRCPFHGERHGAALAVWSDGWKCWGRCGTHGDAIDWLRRYHNLSFQAACDSLRVTPTLKNTGAHPETRRPDSEPPDPVWQKAARQVMHATERLLWSPVGNRALGYLTGRGLTHTTIRQAGLGYWPGKPGAWRWLHGLLVPCGIVIPWMTDDSVWNLKIRRAVGEPKYIGVKGGSTGGLYGADKLTPERTILIVEGEFDQQVAQQESGEWITPVTLGAATIRLGMRWQTQIASCQHILVGCDNDPAGHQARDHFLAQFPHAQPIQYPLGIKDLNELHLRGAGEVRRFLDTYR